MIDVRDPSSPKELGYVGTRGCDVKVMGTYAYVACCDQGVKVIDVSNPAQPVILASMPTSDYCESIALSSNVLYAAVFWGGVDVFDITNPRSPVFVKNINDGGCHYGICVSGSRLYTDWSTTQTFRIFDLSSPLAPAPLGSLDKSMFWGCYVKGMYAYLANGNNGFRIVDVSVPSHPVAVSDRPTQKQANKVWVAGNRAYVGTGAGLYEFDVSVPSQPYQVAYTNIGWVDGVFADGQYVYAGRDNRLWIFETGVKPENPVVIDTSSLPQGAMGVAYSQTLSASAGTSPYIWALASGSLPAGLSLSSSGVLGGTPTVAGTFSFTARVSDHAGQSATKAFTLTVVSAARPDLIVESLTHSPLNPVTSDMVTVSAVVKNLGPGAAPASMLRLACGGESNPPMYSVPALAAGASHTVIRKLQYGVAQNYRNTATADASNTVSEANEGNNQLTDDFTVVKDTARPDLIVESLTHSPLNPVTSDMVTVSAVVKNLGPGAAPASMLRLACGGESDPPMYSVPALAAGVSHTVTRKLQYDIAQNYRNTATADASNTASEANESNNQLTDDFTVVKDRPALSVTTESSLPQGTVGSAYSQTLAGTGGTTPYTWALASSGSLPAGLSLSSGGVISGSPVAAGTFSFTVRVSDSAGQTATKALTLTVNATSTQSPYAGTYEGTYSGGGSGHFSFVVDQFGRVTKFIVDTKEGDIVSGNVSATGALRIVFEYAPFSLEATLIGQIDAVGHVSGTWDEKEWDEEDEEWEYFEGTFSGNRTTSGTGALSITSSSPLSDGTVGIAYSSVLTASGGTTPYATWSVASGKLPAGLSLSQGIISGTPAAAGTFSFKVKVADSAGKTATKAFTLTIDPVSVEDSETLTVGVRCDLGPFGGGGTGGGAFFSKLASGNLPAGMKVEARADGVYVTGVPAKAGDYQAVLLIGSGVDGSTGASIALTLHLAVENLPAWAWGSFNGRVSVWRKDVREPGAVSMTVTAAGKAAGKYSFGGTNYTFAAASYSRRDVDGTFTMEAQIKSGKVALPLEIRVYKPVILDSEVTVPQSLGVAEGWLDGDREHEPPLLMWRDVWRDADMVSVPLGYAGYYTATLPGNEAVGSGYLTLTADMAGKVKTAGKLADGTPVSLAGTLVVDDMGRVFAVLYTSPAVYKGGSFYGLAEFVEPADGGYKFLRLRDGGPALWQSRSPQATETYGRGFTREPVLTGGWYSKTDNLYDYYEGDDLTARTDQEAAAPALTVGANRYSSICWDPSAVVLSPVLKSGVMTGLTAPPADKPTDPDKDGVWDYGAANSVGLKASLARPTGIFKGSFNAWFDYPVKKHVSKSLSFEGVLTPEREDKTDGTEGRGFFLWPDKGVIPTINKSYPFDWSYDFLLSTEWRLVSAPTGVTASKGLYTDRVTVSWTPVAHATHYRVYWALTPIGTKTPVGGWLTSTTITHLTSTQGTLYYFVRAAMDANGSYQSPYSDSATGWLTSTDDLLVTGITLNPAVPESGKSFSASVTVKNTSGRAVVAGDLDVWVNQSAVVSAGTRGNKNVSVGELQSQESKTLTFTGLTAPAGTGSYVFRAFVDSRGAVAESDETNNQFTRAYQVGGGQTALFTGYWGCLFSDGERNIHHLEQTGNSIVLNGSYSGTVSGNSFNIVSGSYYVRATRNGEILQGSYRWPDEDGGVNEGTWTATRLDNGSFFGQGLLGGHAVNKSWTSAFAYRDRYEGAEYFLIKSLDDDSLSEFEFQSFSFSSFGRYDLAKGPNCIALEWAENGVVFATDDYGSGDISVGGWVEITRFDSRLQGSYEITFFNGDTLAGTFDVAYWDPD